MSVPSVGGETAEMPGMYKPGVYDVAGFALGVVEKSQILPKLNDINVSLKKNNMHHSIINFIAYNGNYRQTK